MAVGKGFFDQYSVFCVFGSVVGCVVVPLITQSVEIVIFSAIVISLTAASHLNKKTSNSDNSCKASPFKENDRKKHKESHPQLSKKKSKERQNVSSQSNKVIFQRKYEYVRQENEEQRQFELEKRLEEKKMKKAKKKEERLKRKETELKTKQELEERQRLIYNRRLKQHKEEVQLSSKGSGSGSIASLDRFGHEEPECMQIRRKPMVDENRNPTTGIRIPRFERPRLLTHPCSIKSGRTLTKCEDHTSMGLSVTIPSLSASNSSLSSSGSSQDQDRLTPPPSVWKLPPQNVEPKWNPGQAPQKTGNLKSYKPLDGWCSREPKGRSCQGFTFSGTDIRNLTSSLSPTILSQESASMKGDSTGKAKDESLFTSPIGDRGRADGQHQWSEYSLFGPNQLDKVLFKQPVL